MKFIYDGLEKVLYNGNVYVIVSKNIMLNMKIGYWN